jgi:PPM family protein phosphatase
VLADGMGGYNAGEVASHMATSFIRTELGRWLREASAAGHRRRGAARDGHLRRQRQPRHLQRRQLQPAVRRHGHHAGGGGVPRQGHLLVGHVGDSRAYRLRGGRLLQITRDHSLLQEQIDAGLITPEQAAFSANKNLVTRAVGVEDTVLLETHQHEVLPGDRYLLCSDGLSDMLDDETIAQLMQAHESLPTCGRALIDAANDAGGKDNISVVLVRASGAGSAPGKSWWPFRR